MEDGQHGIFQHNAMQWFVAKTYIQAEYNHVWWNVYMHMDPVGPCRTLAHLLHHCHDSSSHCAMFIIITFGSPSSLPTLSYSLTSALCVLTSSHRWFLCPSLVVEAGKDAGYIGFILAGIGVAGVLFWAVFSEFFSSNSPQKLFAKALRRIKSNEQVRQYSAVCAIHLLCMFVLYTHVYWQLCVCVSHVCTSSSG